MQSRRSTQLVVMYVLSLAASFAFLVVWVLYVVRSGLRLSDLGRQVGAKAEGPNWVLLSVGCSLLFFLIIALTYQLAQALAARRYAQKADELVANITHEMKSPLAAIKLHAQTLQQGEELEAAVRRRFLAVIEQQADRMAALVDAVLESSRLLASKRPIELHPVELEAFLAAYLPHAQAQAESRGIALRIEVETAGRVLATEEGLRRVLDNLIDNAIRYSRPGGEVRCRVSRHGGVARLEVEDDGPGIPKGELPNIFDRFYQARRDHRDARDHRAVQSGTGLGLSIVAGLVREMNGTVRAFSQQERPGTRLLVELPILESERG